MPPSSNSIAGKAPLLLVLAGLLAYCNSFIGDFHLDDGFWILGLEQPPITDNRTLLSASLWINRWLARPAPYRIDTLAIAGGVTPGAYHVVNLAIHLVAALALLGIARFVLRLPQWNGRFAASGDGLAFAIALLWLLHPLHTQAVTYLTQRSESMMGMFYLLAILGLAKACRSNTPRNWYSASILAALLGSASKEVMVTAPFVVAAFDRVFLAPGWLAMFRVRWGYYVALTAASWILPLQTHIIALMGGGVAGLGGEVRLTVWQNLLTQSTVLARYIRLSFWPDALSIEYRDWPAYGRLESVLPEALAVAALLAVTAYALIRGRWFGFLGAWFFGILSITSSVVFIIDPVQEYRMYLPVAALIAGVVVFGHAVLERTVSDGRTRRRCGCAIVGLVALALGTRTFLRNGDYRSPMALWTSNVATRPDNGKNYYQLGYAVELQGKYERAIRLHEKGIERAYKKFLPDAEVRLAFLNWWKGEGEKTAYYIGRTPHSLDSNYYVALGDYRTGNMDEAMSRLQALREKIPNCAALYFTGAVWLGERKLDDESRELLEQGLARFPDYAVYAHQKARHRLHHPFFNNPNGRFEALQLAKEAVLADKGEDPRTWTTLALAQAANKDWRAARVAADAALKLRPAEAMEPRRQLAAWIRCWEKWADERR